MASNIRFHFLYRDSGNYKKFGHCDFSNPDKLSAEEVEKRIRQYLIDGEYFYPEHVKIPRFRFHRFLDDYSWYEFEKVEIIEGKKSKETFTIFLKRLKND